MSQMRDQLTKSQMAGCITMFMAIWLTGWTTIVGCMDVFCAREIVLQHASSKFVSVEGNITASKVVRHRNMEEDTDSLSPEVDYDYFVDGQKHSGNRIRFGIPSMNDAGKTVRRYPAGSETPVYYDPAKPSVSVLEPGLAATDLFMPLFLVPFNMIMLGGIYLFWMARRERSGQRSRIKKRFDGMFARYKVFNVRRPLAAFIVAGATGFASIFVFLFGSLALPEAPLLITLWSIVVLAACWTWWRIRCQTIEVDTARRSVSVVGFDQVPTTIDFRQVNGIEATRKDRPSNFVSAELQIATPQGDVTIDCSSIEDARYLAAELSELKIV